MTRHRLLFALLLLALALFVEQRWSDRPPPGPVLPAADGKQLVYRFADLVYREFDQEGTPRLLLRAPEMHHDPQGEVIEITHPDIEFHHRDLDWRIRAEYGRLNRARDMLALRRRVRVESSGNGEPLAVDCDSLDYNLGDATISTKSRIKLVRGRVDLSGDGMSGNLITGLYHLHQNVEIRLNAPPTIN